MSIVCFLYCISSEYTNMNNSKKLGLTIHPVHRMRVYNTGDAPGIGLEKKYDGLWQVNATSKTELLRLEKHLHTHFNSVRQKKSNGNYTEWFTISFEEIMVFLNSQSYVVRQLSIEEVNIIQKKSENNTTTNEDINDYLEETKLISEQKTINISPVPIISQKDKFFAIFLPGRVPRRIQNELWDLFEKICDNDTLLQTIYKGIVQWPTGTGKTIAILIIIVLIKDRCIRNNMLYRGLLVSPRNDIFNTISNEFNKLSEFDICVYDGSNGQLSSLTIPTDQHVLVMACPQSLLIDTTGMNALPNINHIHYDEVHRITGELYFQLQNKKMNLWKTQFLTGTSATPKTSSKEQHIKLAELFGDPYTTIHKCDIDEAVREGWIAPPRFMVITTPKQDTNTGLYIEAFIIGIKKTIYNKKDKHKWKGGKVIAYLPSVNDTRLAAAIAHELIPEAFIYLAIDSDRTDNEFVNAPANGYIRILFGCGRYREGSDIRGVDMTAVLINNAILAYIIIQIMGRALRNDYDGKEGWCLIVSPCDEEDTERDVLDRITLDILTFIGDSRPLTKKDIEKYVDVYFGNIITEGNNISKEETVARLQAAYVRREYTNRTQKERYDTICRLNKELGLTSRAEYEERASEHCKYIDNPKVYFKDLWISWYHFLGVDISSFPQTKSEWVHLCKEMGVTTWNDYQQKNIQYLPTNPSEMYEDYTNWDKEFGVVDEIVW